MAVLIRAVPEVVNIRIYDWSSVAVDIAVLNPTTKAKQDLTGYSAVVQVRNLETGDSLIELTEGGGVETDPLGNVVFLIDGAVIGPAQWQVAGYDLFLIDGATGHRYAVATGAITVDPSIAQFGV